MAKRKKKKVRINFRKKHDGRTRTNDWTKRFGNESLDEDKVLKTERVSGKGELSRKRTIVTEFDENDESDQLTLSVDKSICHPGRVLSVHGLKSFVESERDEKVYQCATSQLLKSLHTEERHIVATGDSVWFRPEGERDGMIERINPRTGILSRKSRGRQHVIVSNVDQVLVVASAAEPAIKPNLIDRFLISAEAGQLNAIICINKVDLIDPAYLMPLVGSYAQLGYEVLLLSAETGQGVEELQKHLQGRQTVFSGQSGVGKSSLLNVIDSDLQLKVSHVSGENQKGRHTTTATKLIKLSFGGYVVDTPGIRSFALWDVIPEEVAGFFRDIRPFINHCRFPNCSHTHEIDCAVKNAVADHLVDERRYEAYTQIHAGDMI